MEELRNNVDSEVTFKDLAEAKIFYTPNLNEFPECKEYAKEIKACESLEELADILNSYTDTFGNGAKYEVYNMNKYYVEQIKGDDEFTLGKFNTEEEAIEAARDEWARMFDSDKKNCKIEVRQYENDIEDDDCNNFNYKKFEWENHTYETRDYYDTFIDEFATLEKARKAIEAYEKEDKENDCYEEDSYKIYDTFTKEVVR